MVKTFVCDYVINGQPLQAIMEANNSIDCVLALAEQGATAIQVHALLMPVEVVQ